MEKNIDITLYGATGFTGRLIAEYLIKRLFNKNMTIGLAGRNRNLLKEIKSDLQQKINSNLKLEVIEADSSKEETLKEMASRSKVIISTVGPYLKYGEPLIRACIEKGAHYLDITGEGGFVDSMMEKYGLTAKENKVKLINCCGYDSIPADMGAYFTMKEFDGSEPVELECFISFSSSHTNPLAKLQSFSGGTWHSALGFMNLDEMNRQVTSFEKILESNPNRKISPIPVQFRFREDDKLWGAPLPFVDIEVVLRSAGHFNNYGKEFSYGHYAEINNTFLLFGWIVGFGTLFSLAQIPVTKDFLLNLRKPGEGPPKDVRETNYFKHSFIAKSPSKTVRTEVTGGDPGYGDTSKMISECAISILEDDNPEVYGFITPAIGLGESLLKRLPEAGIKFKKI
ncbi:MAG: saccharopine dehydrogenase NADP-binding domain-containing protein [Leptospiraceae bacterium]|nr:saccharopine dehydrogenase NADP-binding domain-containing protein [Leptospiraceae bacterium]